jgi:hypothetical protein
MNNSQEPTPTNQVDKTHSELETVFTFTPDDLRENRQGKLTSSQASHLRQIAQRLAIIILVVIGGLGILTVVTAQPASTDLIPLFLALIIPAVATFAVTIGATEFAILPLVVAKRSGVAHVAYGMLGYTPPLDYGQMMTIPRFRLRGHGSYRLFVGGIEFRLNREQYNAIPAGAYLDIYYLPTIRKIVAIEVVKQRPENDIPEIELPETELLPNLSGLPILPPRHVYDDDDEGIIKG